MTNTKMSDETKYILAIDLGTSGPKVALVSVDGRVRACEIEKTALHLLPDGGAEQDPGEWWQAIGAASRRLFASDGIDPASIAGVCCTGQWSGTVAVDQAGCPLGRAVIWMDSRGASHVKRLTGGWLNISGYGIDKLYKWIRLTGGIPGLSGKDPIAHILHLRAEDPERYAAAYKFLEPKDYLNLCLTGRFAASYDSIILHWVTDNRRINDIRYHPGLLRASGIDVAKLPELKRAVDILGPLRPAAARHLGLPPGLPVVMGAPDLHTAAIGAGAVGDFAAHLYIGTSSWLTCHLPYKKTDLLHNMASLPAAIPGRYLLINEQETAGGCLAFLRDKLLYAEGHPPDDWGVLEDLAARTPPGSNGVIFTPWLYGERTPVENRLIRGGFHNLSLTADRGTLVRAVMEGVALNSRWLKRHVQHFIRQSLSEIRMVGGGARSDLWCQIMADVLECTIHQVDNPVETNARGAGILAAVALGCGTFEAIADGLAIRRVYRPNPSHRGLYRRMFKAFETIYRAHRKICARLNQDRAEKGGNLYGAF
jgi:xylulokinase